MKYNVVFCDVFERLADVFLVDEGLCEGFCACCSLRFGGVHCPHAWWWFCWAGLALCEQVRPALHINWCCENGERCEERGDQDCDAHLRVDVDVVPRYNFSGS